MDFQKTFLGWIENVKYDDFPVSVNKMYFFFKFYVIGKNVFYENIFEFSMWDIFARF